MAIKKSELYSSLWQSYDELRGGVDASQYKDYVLNLLRNITASYPNHVWGVDITYIRLRRDWLYLVAILDWFSRYVLAWQLSDTLEIPFVLLAVDQALA